MDITPVTDPKVHRKLQQARTALGFAQAGTDIRAIRAQNRADRQPAIRLVPDLTAADWQELAANLIEASTIFEAIKRQKAGRMPDGWEQEFWQRRAAMCRNWRGGR